MKTTLSPIGKVKHSSKLSAHGAATTSSSSSSDRSKIALLKSDINLIQAEIDGFTGDPGGFLELQGVLEAFVWSVDAAATAVAREGLLSLLLRKVNELSATCGRRQLQLLQGNKNPTRGPLQQQPPFWGSTAETSHGTADSSSSSSFVRDIVSFFRLQHQYRPSSSHQQQQQQGHRTPSSSSQFYPTPTTAALHRLPAAETPRILSGTAGGPYATAAAPPHSASPTASPSHHRDSAAHSRGTLTPPPPTQQDHLNGNNSGPPSARSSVLRALHPDESSMPPSPVELSGLPADLHNHNHHHPPQHDVDADDDGVCWTAQHSTSAKGAASRGNATGVRSSSSAHPSSSHEGAGHGALHEVGPAAVGGGAAPLLSTTAATSSSAVRAAQETAAKLRRQLAQTKLQLQFFQNIEKNVVAVQSIVDQVTLMAASPKIEQLNVSLQRAVEHFYPQGQAAVAAASVAASTSASAAAAGATLVASPSGKAAPATAAGKKAAGGKKGDDDAAQHNASIVASVPAKDSAVLHALLHSAGPLDEKKLRIAIAFQNAVIESILESAAEKRLEYETTVKEQQEQIASMQKRMEAVAQSTSRERTMCQVERDRAVSTLVRAQSAASVGRPSSSSDFEGASSRPLSRISMSNAGGLLNFLAPLHQQQQQQLLTMSRAGSAGLNHSTTTASHFLMNNPSHHSQHPPLASSAAVGGALPPRAQSAQSSSAFAAIAVPDHSDAVFGTASRPASGMNPHDELQYPAGGAAQAVRGHHHHYPPRSSGLGGIGLQGGRPIVATRAEDLEGEKERRYLQVIRSQADIIKEMTNNNNSHSNGGASVGHGAAGATVAARK